MNPNQNGYLAHYYQNPFYFNLFIPTFDTDFRFNYVPTQFLLPEIPFSMPQSVEKTERIENSHQEDQLSVEKEKVHQKRRPIKKLVQINIPKEMHKIKRHCQRLRKSFHYLDPSRAPPITTLRNRQELESDFKQEFRARFGLVQENIPKLEDSEKTLVKLELLMKEPDEYNYPFMVCRKYHYPKKRYSARFLYQRAECILNHLPIPTKFMPKHTLLRKQPKSKSQTPFVESSEDCQDDEGQDPSYFQESRSKKAKKQNEDSFRIPKKSLKLKKRGVGRYHIDQT